MHTVLLFPLSNFSLSFESCVCSVFFNENGVKAGFPNGQGAKPNAKHHMIIKHISLGL